MSMGVQGGPGLLPHSGQVGEARSCSHQKRGIAHQSSAPETCQRGRSDWLLAHGAGSGLECLERYRDVVSTVVSVSPRMVQVPLDAGLRHGQMKRQ